MCAQQGDRRLEGAARTYLGAILLEQDELEAAEREATLAVSLLDSTPPLRPHAMAILADVWLARGQSREALEVAEDAMKCIGSGDAVEEGIARARLVFARAQAANGDEAGARATLEAARGWLLGRAARLDPSRCDGFLRAIPEHRQLLEGV
jgi:eukaryotic-like serine/threonine-protein kinase